MQISGLVPLVRWLVQTVELLRLIVGWLVGSVPAHTVHREAHRVHVPGYTCLRTQVRVERTRMYTLDRQVHIHTRMYMLTLYASTGGTYPDVHID